MSLRQRGNCFRDPEAKHHGLANQGATCYLNSVLQVLFMTKAFREAVERHTCRNPGSECMVCDLKSLFADLNGKTAHTNEITKRLGIDRVYEQRDAAEYFERILTLTSPEASQIFHGQLTHKTTCSGCRTEKNADGQFWHLPLEWVYSHSKGYSVVDGTEEYFKDSHYNGENQMYCDQCDAKSDATIKCVIKDHPESLMLLLKRFEFDYHYMTYVKNKHAVDVPCTLQIPENQTYELYAFVEHFGDLRGGHYTATIKSQDDDLWYNFDDTRVTELYDQPLQTWRSQSVYLLFYKKKKTDAADTCTQDVTNGGLPPASKENYDQCQGAEKIRARREDEETEEVHHDTAEAASRNEETASRNVVSVGSLYNHQESSEERCEFCGYSQGAHAENCQGDEGPIIRGPKEEGSTGADDQADKRGLFPTGTPLEERAQDQDYNPGGHHNIRQNNEVLDSVRKNINDDQEDKQEDGRDYSVESVSVGKEGDEEMEMEVDVKDAEEGKSAAAGLTSGGGQLLTRYDLYNQGLQDNGRIGDSKQNREERRDVEGDKEQKRGDDRHAQRKRTSTTKRYLHEGVEDQVNRAEQKISDTHTRHEEVGVKRQTNGQEEKEGNEHQIGQESSLRQAGLTVRGLSDSSGKKTRQGNSQPKERSGFEEYTGGRGGSKHTEIHVKITETEEKETPSGIQRNSETKTIKIERKSDPKKGNSQPKERSGFEEYTGGRGGSKHTEIHVKITETEEKETPSGIQRNSETKTIKIERKI